LPETYYSLILQALDCYKKNQMMQIDRDLAGRFADQMLTIIELEKEQ
jgi:hypothetical protein